MRNEKQKPLAPRRKRQGSTIGSWSFITLLCLPLFHQTRPPLFRAENEELRPAALALPQAHAHNDYRHEKPLWEAISRGFSSVEADVHLVNGELYLGHWIPRISDQTTLRALYLQPLSALMSRQNGKVYPNFEGIFYLMIDIKTNAEATYRVLRDQVLQYPVLQNNPHFRLFISGNRAFDLIQQDPAGVAAVDGRLSDLPRHVNSTFMPVISDNFRHHFDWRGEGRMPAEEREYLQRLVLSAHRQGKKLRFWNIPDQPNAWEVLLNAGLDFISTDHLQGLEQFLSAHQKTATAEPSSVVQLK
ncbi:MAG: phosphatidylinositol-specific phospholipase C/glycerophosphodiester phosphodiesterase family protein [Saprospiraceae bacterium]|nr:phosphatidylinositol-specific phospholipase C/glycerophosphodiester phosphodiesterase family protein [Saprospiraceae bacterium]